MEYRKLIKIEIRDFTRDVLEKSWEWLSDPQIKEQTNTPDIDMEQSEKWFESLKNRKDYFIKSIWHNNKPIAVMGLKHINGKDAETMGYIGEKEYWGKTIGIQGMEYLIESARSLELESIYSIIRKSNLSSYKLNRRLGFVKEGDKDENNIIMRRVI